MASHNSNSSSSADEGQAASVVSSENNSLELDSFLSKSFLDLEKIDANLFRSKALWQNSFSRVVYGGQVIGQALVAASQGISDQQHIHSLHSYFLKGGTSVVPILYHVDKTREGRTYCTRSVKAVQSGSVIFTMQASFKQEEPFSTVHQLTMPEVPHPDELETLSESLMRFGITGFRRVFYDEFAATVKMVQPEHYLLLQNRAYYPKRQFWIKAKGHIGADQHQNVHKCCLAYLSDAMVISTALMRLGPMKNYSSIFMTSLDHSMWFHAPCRADEWLLYQTETDHIGDGRALCRGSIWDMNGTLVTTVTQEGVLRHQETPSNL